MHQLVPVRKSNNTDTQLRSLLPSATTGTDDGIARSFYGQFVSRVFPVKAGKFTFQ